MIEKTTTWEDPRNDPRYKYKPIQIPMQVRILKLNISKNCHLLTVKLFSRHCMEAQKIMSKYIQLKIIQSKLFKATQANLCLFKQVQSLLQR